MSDTKKAPIDLIPLRALIGAARVLEYGNSRKDGRQPGDFIDRPLDGVFYASTLRHTMELQRLQGGVTLETLAARDADSNLPVIDHIITNLLIIRALAIRDGVLPEDPVEAHRRLYDGRSITVRMGGRDVRIEGDATLGKDECYLRYAPEGKATWHQMSAELADEVLDEPEPLPPQPGSGPVSCGIVDCRACTKAEELSEDVPTNKFEIGAARTEGVRW